VITPAAQLPASRFLTNVPRKAFSRNLRTVPASYHQPARWTYSSLGSSSFVCIFCAFMPLERNIYDYVSQAGTSACVRAVKRKTNRAHNSLVYAHIHLSQSINPPFFFFFANSIFRNISYSSPRRRVCLYSRSVTRPKLLLARALLPDRFTGEITSKQTPKFHHGNQHKLAWLSKLNYDKFRQITNLLI